ncbi:TetR/AcrR family transcriptional regulator C-terminal ligand-binding domain-containing protein [Saccharopolyspora sp. NPDC002686]|uniref:TetR/AcrR family transcriptional regulator C-terminal ligand-binding domain-containing protein n=1 Tax=Saccharopolyspora sp. NPDC002686 TaxID=3154541 RepID=UPI0033230A58
MAEALCDEHAAELLREFTAGRREELSAVLAPWVPAAELDLAVDQAFGVLWYRLLLGHAPVDRSPARSLAALLVRQLQSA